MNVRRYAVSAAIAGALSASLAYAQTTSPPPATGTSSPDSASSPHQRESTRNTDAESPATSGTKPADAATPHQHDVMKSASAPSDKMMAPGATGGATPTVFVKKAGLAGMTEVELGKLAQKNAKSDNVKEFADRMVKDHTKANTELTGIASRKNYDVPKALDAEHQAVVDELKGKSGASFDSAYAEHMMTAHSKAIALFKDASTSSDADLAAFAKKTLPTLQEHKKMADGLKSGMKTASAGATSKE